MTASPAGLVRCVTSVRSATADTFPPPAQQVAGGECGVEDVAGVMLALAVAVHPAHGRADWST